MKQFAAVDTKRKLKTSRPKPGGESQRLNLGLGFIFMQLLITESIETTTTEVTKETTLNVDISKLDDDERSELLTELLDNMSDEDIEDCIDNNNKMLIVILRSHVYINNKKIRNMVYVLEGDVESGQLEEDLMLLIEKYNLQDEL